MDYRKFLARRETLVLPYFGGSRVDAPGRRLRVREADAAELAPGWWRFEASGRRAVPTERAEPPDLSDLPAVRGHVAAGYLFRGGREVERFALPPEIEPEPLAPCTGRRWHGGELLFGDQEFEDDAEMAARAALDASAALGDVKGVAPSLRAAFGYAVARAAGRELDIAIAPGEAAPYVHDIAARGRDAAIELLRRLDDERREWQRLLDEERHTRELERTARRARPATRAAGSPEDRAEAALEAAGARMIRCRRLGGGTLEVTFAFLGEQFITVAHGGTLHVYDAGICLSGADEELTLDSLPSAIREAIDTGQLYITRHG